MESPEVTEKALSRSNRKVSRRIWSLPFFAFGGVAFLILAYLCQSAQLVRIQYEVLARRGEVKALAQTRDDLELTVQELTSLERVEHFALNELKMVAPQERRIIEVVWSKAPEVIPPVAPQAKVSEGAKVATVAAVSHP